MNCPECKGRMHECHPFVVANKETGTPASWCISNGRPPAGGTLPIHRPGDWWFCLFCDVHVPAQPVTV